MSVKPPQAGPPQLGPYQPVSRTTVYGSPVPIQEREHETRHGEERGERLPKPYRLKGGRKPEPMLRYGEEQGARLPKPYRIYQKPQETQEARHGETLQRFGPSAMYAKNVRKIEAMNKVTREAYERRQQYLEDLAVYTWRREQNVRVAEWESTKAWLGTLPYEEQVAWLERKMLVSPEFRTSENVAIMEEYYAGKVKEREVAYQLSQMPAPQVPKSLTQTILDLPDVPANPLDILKREPVKPNVGKEFLAGVVAVPESTVYSIASLIGIETPPIPLSPSGLMGAEARAGHLKASPLETIRSGYRLTPEMEYMQQHPAYLVGGLVGEVGSFWVASKVVNVATEKVSKSITNRIMAKYVENPLSLSSSERWVLRQMEPSLATQAVSAPNVEFPFGAEAENVAWEIAATPHSSLMTMAKYGSAKGMKAFIGATWIKRIHPYGGTIGTQLFEEPVETIKPSVPYLPPSEMITRTASPSLYAIGILGLRVGSKTPTTLEEYAPSSAARYAAMTRMPVAKPQMLMREKVTELLSMPQMPKIEAMPDLAEDQKVMFRIVQVPVAASMVKQVQSARTVPRLLQKQTLEMIQIPEFAGSSPYVPEEWLPRKSKRKQKDFKRTVDVRYYGLLYPTWRGKTFLKKMMKGRPKPS